MKFSESLKKNADFRKVYNKGKSKADSELVFYVLKNDLNRNRIGISVSKKVGNSVIRHHLTRLIREIYRLHEEEFCPGWDFVIVVRVKGRECSYHELEKSFLYLAHLHTGILSTY